MCSGTALSNEFMQIIPWEALQDLMGPVIAVSVNLAIPEIQFVECRPSSSSFKLPSNKQSFLIIAKEGPSLGSHGV